MLVIKFGGTSVGDADRVANAIDIVAERRDRDPIVVVSALAGVTNDLVAASEAACAQKPKEVETIIRGVRQRHEDVAIHLVQLAGVQIPRDVDANLQPLRSFVIYGSGTAGKAEFTAFLELQ